MYVVWKDKKAFTQDMKAINKLSFPTDEAVMKSVY